MFTIPIPVGVRRVWELAGEAGRVLAPGTHAQYVRDLALVWPTMSTTQKRPNFRHKG